MAGTTGSTDSRTDPPRLRAGSIGLWYPADRGPELTATAASLEQDLRGAGHAVVRHAVDPLERPTPGRRRERRAAIQASAGEVELAVVAGGAWFGLDASLGLAEAGRPLLLVDLAPGDPPLAPGGSLDASRGAPPPVAALEQLLARRVLESVGTPVAGDRLLDAVGAPPAPDGSPVDPDLLASAERLLEDYRRLADWSVDLAEQQSDLESARGPGRGWRRLRRRVRRFLRKRGLI